MRAHPRAPTRLPGDRRPAALVGPAGLLGPPARLGRAGERGPELRRRRARRALSRRLRRPDDHHRQGLGPGGAARGRDREPDHRVAAQEAVHRPAAVPPRGALHRPEARRPARRHRVRGALDTDPMTRRSREMLRMYAPYIGALAAMILLSVAVSLYVIVHERFRFPWQHQTTIYAQFENAQSVTPGQGQTVDVAGVQVGEIGGVELKNGRAVVQMNLTSDDLGPVYRSARLQLRPKTG